MYIILAALALLTSEAVMETLQDSMAWASIWAYDNQKVIALTLFIAFLTAAAMYILSQLYEAHTAPERKGKDFDNTVVALARLAHNADSTLSREGVQQSVQQYDELFKGYDRKKAGGLETEESKERRVKNYDLMVNNFYDLVTDFYEYGWCQSFHFAQRYEDETFLESIRRSEHFLALSLALGEGKVALDMGCGIGGPMREIARFSSANVLGLTINQYQVKVGNKYNEQKGLADKCKIVQGDFMKMPWSDNHFDAVYAIESTCHAPDKVAAYGEAFRVLKPGGLFAGYEWVVTEKFNGSDPRHVAIKEGIEMGNGLPPMASPQQVVAALRKCGFEVLESYDMHEKVHDKGQVPWYDTLDGKMTLSGFRMTRIGRVCTHALVSSLEMLGIAPKGAARVSEMLNLTADDLVDGGKKEIFSPDYFFLARKPLTST